MIPKDGINLQYLKGAFFRRFWYVVLPFFLFSLATIVYCIIAPRVYKAETLILVEVQKVPGEYVRSTVTTDLTDRLRSITQQIKSRTRLEGIINKYDLYPDIRADATMTDAVKAFRENIEINVRGGRSAFEVSFQGRDRVKVRNITDTIANLFIEDNLKMRELQAMGTARFIDRELEQIQDTLRQKETALRQFKEKYRGFLPEHMDQNYRMMSHLQRQLDSVNASMEQTKDRKVLLETQLNNLERMETQFGSFEVGGGNMLENGDQGTGPTAGWMSPDAEGLRNQLRNLKFRYSDKHPDVIKLQAAIAKLEQEQAAEQEAGSSDADSEELSGDTDTSGLAVSEGMSLFDAQKEDLFAQLQMIGREVHNLHQDQKKIKEQMETYLRRIESGPQIEQMLVDLSRGYDQIRENYRSLLQKKFQAGLAENLERAQQAEQFTILDPAKLPDKPFKPRTRKILLLGCFLSLTAGFGLAFLREYLDSSFFSAKELESSVQIPVLASVPVITTDKDRRWIFVRKAMSTAAMVSMALILLYGLYFLWKMDPMVRSFSLI